MVLALLAALLFVQPQPAAPPDAPPAEPSAVEGVVRLPHVEADLAAQEVRVACEQIVLDVPLEFICVVAGTADHEAVLRTLAKPSDVHAALLSLGLEPGKPVRWSEAAGRFLPPEGPPVRVSVRFERDGREVDLPIERLIQGIESGRAMPPRTWSFVGSQLGPNGEYAANFTGQIVSLVNFETTVLDIATLASDANEALLWRLDKGVAPPMHTPVTMVLSPVGDKGATDAGTDQPNRGEPVDAEAEEVDLSKLDIDALKARWRDRVTPGADALRTAAQTHYDVIRELRQEQQRLITEADRLQRVIDELEREYQDLVTPRPAPTTRPGDDGKGPGA